MTLKYIYDGDEAWWEYNDTWDDEIVDELIWGNPKVDEKYKEIVNSDTCHD